MATWGRFVGGRLVGLMFVVLCLAVASSLMVRLIPGDPALSVAGISATRAQLTAVRHQLGIDEPLLTQERHYFARLLRGNLGTSFATGQPVTDVIRQEIGSSLTLAAVAIALVLVVAIPLGVIAGAFTREGRHRRTELLFTSITSVAGSLPQFLLATFLAFVFAVWLRVLPVAGSQPPVKSLILPALAVAIAPAAILARLVRVEVLNVLAQDYIRMARAKRLPGRIIYRRHVLPNVLTAALTLGGVIFANIVGGAVVVENVFNRNGLGTGLVTAVISHDYSVAQGDILVLGVIIVVVNALVDCSLAILTARPVA